MDNNTMVAQLYHGKFRPLDKSNELEQRWRALEPQSNCSFFLTWSWIGTWLQLVHTQAVLQVYECYCDEELIGLAIINLDTVKRRQLFYSRMVSINEVNQDSLNMFIEYNGVLAKTGVEAEVFQQLIDDLYQQNPHWDEFRLTNIPIESYRAINLNDISTHALCDAEHIVWAAPLTETTSPETIVSTMSKNRRWQIRRSFKEYAKEGPLTIDEASTLSDAQNYFLQMGVFHTERWNRVGKSGSFAQTPWIQFHQRLIDTAFARGEIQLLRIRCGNRDLGYIYSFLWRGSVLMLQSGFTSEPSNVLRPGYISHILAMQLNAQSGATQYDFMIGDADYKKVLGVAQLPLVSVRLQRPRLKFTIENGSLRIYRKIRQLTRDLINPAAQKLQHLILVAITWTVHPDTYYKMQSIADII